MGRGARKKRAMRKTASSSKRGRSVLGAESVPGKDLLKVYLERQCLRQRCFGRELGLLAFHDGDVSGEHGAVVRDSLGQPRELVQPPVVYIQRRYGSGSAT